MLHLVVEGDVDEAVGRRIARTAGWREVVIHGKKGKDWITQNLPRYAQAARYGAWGVLRDLDDDAECAPALIASLDSGGGSLCLRVAVRTVDAWLLADREGIGALLRVPASAVPRNVERLQDPKREIVSLARRSSSMAIRRAFVPRPGASTKVGPAYVSYLTEFAQTKWSVESASETCASLDGCLRGLERLRSRGR
jgi:hypothetical protein